jgi:tRNA threonylcarbamoyladenosine biosynthesis protein TsaE
MNKQTFITTSDKDTQKLGEEFALKLRPKDVVFLLGELGGGKTTFVKGIAKALGIKTRIMSPTFVFLRSHEIMNQESIIKNQGIKRMYHLDLYRLDDASDIKNLALDDLFNDPEAVTIIEWPEKIKSLPQKTYKILFEHRTKDSRKITIEHMSS